MTTPKEGLEKLLANVYTRAKKAVEDVADDIASIASTTAAPVRTGFLRASIKRITDTKIAMVKGGMEISSGVVARTPYAEIQHENVFKHPIGGSDHYLTGPLEAGQDKYLGYISKALKAAINESAEGS